MRDTDSKLRRIFEGGRVRHAYLITGPGREDFAAEMAAALVCEGTKKPCGSCAHCKKAALHIHPDILSVTVEEGKREILVDQIRELRADAYIRPNEAQKKVYLIDPASELNANAQNALLKILEEGPSYACFLLVSETAGALLPTVRSRCEEIFLFSGKEDAEEFDRNAVELAELLLKGDEYGLLSHCVKLEKLNREEISRLLNETVMVLEGKIKKDVHSASGILPLIERLQQLQAAAEYNIGTGHLAGWLCAATFQ